jgi:hypothetical protein
MLLNNELEENGITVLAPDKGWLYAHPHRSRVLYSEGFRPLPTEKNMSPGQVERRFLKSLGQASLVYLHNPEGYLGTMTSMELGFALGDNKPIYAKQPLEPGELALENIELWLVLSRGIKVVPIPEIVADYHATQVPINA